MIVDLLSSAVPVASDILQRTASTPRVQQIVSLSLAPAFLLAAIGAIMNVLVSRMIWIANRIERIDDRRTRNASGWKSGARWRRSRSCSAPAPHRSSAW